MKTRNREQESPSIWK